MNGGGDTPTKTQWKLNAGYGYICGKYENGKIFIEGPEETLFFGIDESGEIIATLSTATLSLQQLKDMLSPYFEEISTVQILIVTGLAIGDDVPNWEDYKHLNP